MLVVAASRPPGSVVDDVDEHAVTVLDGSALDDRPQGSGGAPAAADDVAVVVLRNRELEDDGAVVFGHLRHLDLVRLVDEAPGEVLEQISWGAGLIAHRMPCVRSSLRT